MTTNKTYHIITIGCQMNKSDSERIASYLENLGYQESSEKEADLVVITTCGVRQSAENRIYGIIPKLKKQNPSVKIILTGCLAGREDVKKRIGEKVDIWLPVKELEKLKALLENCEDDFCNTSIYNSKYKTNDDYLKLKPKYNSVFSAFVPIGNGCGNFLYLLRSALCARIRKVSQRGRDIGRGKNFS